MNIVLIQDHLRSGGTERTTVFLARRFAEAGHRVRLLTFRPGGALAPTVRESGIDHVALQPFDFRLDWLAPGLPRAARSFSPDVVVAMGRMANCHAWRLQRALPDAAVIATLRTGKNLPFFFRKSLRESTHIVANSRYARDHWSVGLTIPRGRFSVIPNGIVHPLPDRPTIDRRERENVSPDETVFLNTAMFRPEKDHAELLRAFAEVPPAPPWRLWLVGDGQTLSACRRLTRSLGLEPRVRFFGLQSNPADFYHSADVAVLTSRSESLPNFLVEAQWCGLPVVVYDVAGVDETFIDGESGFLIPNRNRASLVERLKQLLNDPDLRQRQSAAARNQARDKFNPDSQAAAWLKLLEEVRDQKPDPSW